VSIQLTLSQTRKMAQPYAFNLLMIALAPCPTTRWDVTDVLTAPRSSRRMSFLQSVHRPNDVDTEDGEIEWIRQNGQLLMETLHSCGAIHFRGFASPRTTIGLRQFCEALPLIPCKDPLTSVGVRGALGDGVYRAVDSESLSKTFIGLHNDATYRLAAPFAAFACFQAADRGGEFLLADGREVLSALSPSLLQQLHDRRLRVRVAALPTEWLAHGGPMPPTVRTLLASVIEGVIGAALAVGVPLGLELAWSSDGKWLQILEPTKSAFNRHPVSREPTFFSGVHSQSRYLQQARAADMFGGVGVTDVLDGDLAPLEIELLDEIESVMTRLTRRVLMQPGDVVLLDSYQTLHGRETFEGPRRHGVLWLTSR
jgi:hypothetical protein